MTKRIMKLSNKHTTNSMSRTSLYALVASTAMLTSTQAYAQETKGSDDVILEEVVVTGSNIRTKRDFSSPSPVQTLGGMDIQNTGPALVQDIFKGLTVNSGSQTSNRQNNRQGVSQFSLRGLGLGSTLTLINGRRAGLAPVSDETGTLFTDINQYPVNMIERVEVLTDGASATYGSEAVAGVVNIITRKNFEGLELTGEFRDASNQSYQIGGAFGGSTDRSKFSVFVTAYHQTGNFRGDFDFIRDNLNFSSSTGSPGSYRRASHDGVTGLVNGSINNNTVGGATKYFADPDCLAVNQGFTPLNGTQIDSSGRCRYNFINQRRLIAEEDRIQAFGQYDYDITDNIHFSTEVSFSRNEIRDALGGAVNRTGPINGDFIVPGSHPFNFFVDNGAGGITYADPTTNAAAWADGTLQAVDITARFRPLGSRFDGPNAEDISSVFNNVRVSTGLDIELSDNWFLNANYTYADSEFRRREPRNWAVDLLQGFLTRGAWNPFGTALATPNLASPKPGASGTAANDEETFRQFNRVKTSSGRVRQKVAELILSGELGDLFGGGPIGAAFGFQYRDVLFQDFPDGLSGVLEGGREDPTFPVTGSQNVYALFGELAVPIGDRIETQLALRYEDYGDQGGNTLDPKFAVRFNATDQLLLRASIGTSFQAPSIRQIAGAVGNAGIDDPLDPGSTFNVVIFTKGSANLAPQSATNWNLGVAYSGDNGLDLSVDFWHYKYNDLILPGDSAQSIVDNDPNDPRVLRDGSGQLTGVNTEFLNRGDATAEGIDIKALYTVDIENSQLRFDASTTYITKYRSTDFAGLDGNGNLKGSRNANNAFGSVPDLKINGGVTWSNEQNLINVSVRYINSYTDDQTGDPINSQTTLDARYTLTLDGLLGNNNTSAVTVGVVNAFDTQPPIIGNRPGFDTEVHDPRGRQIYIRLKQNF